MLRNSAMSLIAIAVALAQRYIAALSSNRVYIWTSGQGGASPSYDWQWEAETLLVDGFIPMVHLNCYKLDIALVILRNSYLNKSCIFFTMRTTQCICPLDLSGSNFTLAASVCSNQVDRGKCCRSINAFIAISVSRYANATGELGVPSNLSDICLKSVSQTLELYGMPPNATILCGLGTKILVNYQCKGRTTVAEMLQSPNFEDVVQNCEVPLSPESRCRRCLNAGILFLHRLIGAEGNMTLSTCRDASFVTLASRGDNVLATNLASCFFGVQELSSIPGKFCQ
ncbi:hypothetical protein ACLOJK_001199 [Asimina triloba]